MPKKFAFITFFSLFLILCCAFLFIHITSTQAAHAISNCVITTIGQDGIQTQLPSFCHTGGWPFARKDSSEYRRIDAGFDIQENHIEDTAAGKTWLYAIAAGTVHLHTDGCSSCTGGGYGPHYPYVTLDTPITFNGKTHTNYFYGHTIMIPELEGKHVNAGDKIAWTGPNGCSWDEYLNAGHLYAHKADDGSTYYDHWCGNGGSYWAEIGWGTYHPEGNDDTGDRRKCIDSSNIDLDPLYNHGDPCAWTQSGKDMKDYLLGNP